MNQAEGNGATLGLAGSRWVAGPSLKLDKMMAAELVLDPQVEPRACFLSIQDVDARGMRVHADQDLEPGSSLRVHLFSEEILDLPVVVEGLQDLHGGLWRIDLRFAPATDRDAQAIERLVGALAPQNRRRSVRVHRVLAVEVLLEGSEACTMDLSESGMRVLHEAPLPVGHDIPLRLQLGFGAPPLEVTGRVAWQNEEGSNHFRIGLEFVGLTPQAARRLGGFVQGVLTGRTRPPAASP